MKIADIAAVRAAEAAAVSNGITEFTLMIRAGRFAADLIASLMRRYGFSRVVFLCGSGNNAGDAMVAAALLYGAYPLSLYAARSLSTFKGAAAEAANFLPDELKHNAVIAGDPVFRPGDLIVDGLLGIGLKGEVRPDIAKLIAEVNASGLPVLSLDVPSGMDADTGRGLVPGGEAVRARWVLTFGAAKPGLFTDTGIRFSSGLRVADIGLEPFLPSDTGADAYAAAEAFRDLPRFANDVHKNRRGSALVMAGSRRYPGAGGLATLGCLRGGAGLVRTLYPDGANPPLPASAIPVVLNAVPDWSTYSASVLVAGSGWGDEYSPAVLSRVLEFPGPLLLDADGLNRLSRNPHCLNNRRHWVVTPHPGEAERLRKAFSLPENLSRPELAAALAVRLGAVVVLKGARSIVADRERGLSYNTSGSSVLATAGSGDVLSGLIGAFIANGMPVYDAARLGVFVHGAAGEACGRGCVADDLPLAAAAILRDLEMGLFSC